MLTAAIVGATALKIASQEGDSPVERVVSMMKHMQAECVKEEEAETEIHNKKQCKCRLETEALNAQIKAADASAKAAAASFVAASTGIASAEAQAADAQENIDEYTKESRQAEDDFQSAMSALDARERQAVNDQTALDQAQKVLSRGDNLLQAQNLIRSVVGRVDVAASDVGHLSSFLQSTTGKASDFVKGIITNMNLDLQREIKNLRQTRAEKSKNHQNTMDAFSNSKRASRAAKQQASSAFAQASKDKLTSANDKMISRKEAAGARATLDTLTNDCRQALNDFQISSAARRDEEKGLGKAMEILAAGRRVLREATSDAFIQMESRRTKAASLLQVFSHKQRIAKVVGMLQARDVKAKILSTIEKVKSDNKESMGDLSDLQDDCISDMHKAKTDKAEAEGDRNKASNAVEGNQNTIEAMDDKIADYQKNSQAAKDTIKSSTETFTALTAENNQVIAANTQSIPVLSNALTVLQKIYNPATRAGEHPILKLVEKIIDDCKSVVKDTTEENAQAQASHVSEVDEANSAIFDAGEAVKKTSGSKGRALADKADNENDVQAALEGIEGANGSMEATIKGCKGKHIDTAEGVKAFRAQIAKERDDLKQENSALTQAKQVLNGADFA